MFSFKVRPNAIFSCVSIFSEGFVVASSSFMMDDTIEMLCINALKRVPR